MVGVGINRHPKTDWCTPEPPEFSSRNSDAVQRGCGPCRACCSPVGDGYGVKRGRACLGMCDEIVKTTAVLNRPENPRLQLEGARGRGDRRAGDPRSIEEGHA